MRERKCAPACLIARSNCLYGDFCNLLSRLNQRVGHNMSRPKNAKTQSAMVHEEETISPLVR